MQLLFAGGRGASVPRRPAEARGRAARVGRRREGPPVPALLAQGSPAVRVVSCRVVGRVRVIMRVCVCVSCALLHC